jgi:hydroxyacylglutathione hydrolase
MYFQQIPVGRMRNFSYLLGCEKTKVAAVVDPAFEGKKLVERAESAGYRIEYIFTTHGHHDHVGGHREMIHLTGAKVIVHQLEAEAIRRLGVPVDIVVEDGDEIKVGSVTVRILHTPGHTPGGICLLIEGEKLITGDTLFVGDCGRADLAGGSGKDLFKSIHEKLMSLDDRIEVYPGHDYGEKPSSTLGEEKKRNVAMMCKSLEEFMALP